MGFPHEPPGDGQAQPAPPRRPAPGSPRQNRSKMNGRSVRHARARIGHRQSHAAVGRLGGYGDAPAGRRGRRAGDRVRQRPVQPVGVDVDQQRPSPGSSTFQGDPIPRPPPPQSARGGVFQQTTAGNGQVQRQLSLGLLGRQRSGKPSTSRDRTRVCPAWPPCSRVGS